MIKKFFEEWGTRAHTGPSLDRPRPQPATARGGLRSQEIMTDEDGCVDGDGCEKVDSRRRPHVPNPNTCGVTKRPSGDAGILHAPALLQAARP